MSQLLLFFFSFGYFYSKLIEQFNRFKQDSGYVNAGIIADKVCQILNISFQGFEKKLNEFVEIYKGTFTFAPLTTRYDLEKKSEIIIVKKRNHGVKESFNKEWLEHRDLIDGVKIKGKLMRIMKLN